MLSLSISARDPLRTLAREQRVNRPGQRAERLNGEIKRRTDVVGIFPNEDPIVRLVVAEFDHAILAKDTRHPFVVQCEQFKTSQLLLKGVRALLNVESPERSRQFLLRTAMIASKRRAESITLA